MVGRVIPFDIYSFTLGFQADIYQQNGGLFPTLTVQSNVTRSRTSAAFPIVRHNLIFHIQENLSWHHMTARGRSRARLP